MSERGRQVNKKTDRLNRDKLERGRQVQGKNDENVSYVRHRKTGQKETDEVKRDRQVRGRHTSKRYPSSEMGLLLVVHFYDIKVWIQQI